MTADPTGALIDGGPADWQIIQQDADGRGHIHLNGRWIHPEPGTVEARLVAEDTGAAVGKDWQATDTASDGTWTTTLADLPAGGLYRLETRLNPTATPAGEWSPRGDMRYFLGIGDLWVIAGQSNSAGYGRGPYEDPPCLGVHLLRNSGRWALASHPMNESTDTRHPVNRENANPGHSPYLQFGRLLQRALGYPIGLVQTALGGSPLSAWNPAQGEAPLYQNMLDCINEAGGRVRGILWYQGESDTATDADAASYAQRFSDAVAAWRDALDAPDLPVLTVQLNRHLLPPNVDADRRWTQVRQAQRLVAQKDACIGVVPTFDLPLSDGIHTSPAGNMLLGERLARLALNQVYGRPEAALAPDLTAARRSDDGRSVLLTFAHVTSRLASIDPEAQPFRLEDADGPVPIDALTYPRTDQIQLKLSRPLKGKTQVHGGWGAIPQTMPMDIERFVPLLGFYGVEAA